MQILLDTDIGTDVDDALALALALRCPEIDLLGVTTVSGDPSLRARIARKIISLAGKEYIPVAAGCGPGLLQKKLKGMWGHEGQGILQTARDGMPCYPAHAVDLMVEQIKKSPNKIRIITIGPLTNLALVIIKEPWIVDHIERLVVMGGSVYPERMGEQWGIPAEIAATLETNLGADPEAAEVVFRAGMPMTLVPVEVTCNVYFTDVELSRLRTFGTPLTQTLSVAIDIWVPALKKMLLARFGRGDFARPYLHDPLTVAVALGNRFVKTEMMHLDLKRQDGYLRTTFDMKKEANTEVVVSVDAVAFRTFLVEMLCQA